MNCLSDKVRNSKWSTDKSYVARTVSLETGKDQKQRKIINCRENLFLSRGSTDHNSFGFLLDSIWYPNHLKEDLLVFLHYNNSIIQIFVLFYFSISVIVSNCLLEELIAFESITDLEYLSFLLYICKTTCLGQDS